MSDTALFGADAPAIATEAMKRDALERELAYRRRVYPRLVLQQKMSQAQADRQIWLFERILAEGYRP